jgi:hypothetical protein
MILSTGTLRLTIEISAFGLMQVASMTIAITCSFG